MDKCLTPFFLKIKDFVIFKTVAAFAITKELLKTILRRLYSYC